MPNTEISNSATVQATAPHPVFYDTVNGITVHFDPVAKQVIGVPGADGATPAAAVIFPIQAPTGSAPAYKKGGIYFDTTLNKLRIGGASAWETVTSS